MMRRAIRSRSLLVTAVALTALATRSIVVDAAVPVQRRLSSIQSVTLQGAPPTLRITANGPLGYRVLSTPAAATLQLKLYQVVMGDVPASLVFPFGNAALSADASGNLTLALTINDPGLQGRVGLGSGANIIEVELIPRPPADTAAPVVSAISVSDIRLNGATVSWTTDEPATTQVDYGTTTAYGQSSPAEATFNTQHSVALGGLTQDTGYFFRVRSADAAGNAGSGTGSFWTAEPAFLESNGQVVIEAERADSLVARGGKSWQVKTAQTGFAGTGYIEALPNTGVRVDTNYATTVPEARYKVNFTQTGTYTLWLRAAGPTVNDDSIHAGLDGVAAASADLIGDFSAAWAWEADTKDSGFAVITVATPGVHTVNLWMREDGIRVDRILLRKDPSTVPPAGQGPAESPRQP